jgi:hypothetical protein
VAEIRKYDLQVLETEYRKLTALSDLSALEKIRSILAMLRYDVNNNAIVHMEYRDGLPEPILMRIIYNEKDLDRWVEQRFVRLSEFQDRP